MGVIQSSINNMISAGAVSALGASALGEQAKEHGMEDYKRKIEKNVVNSINAKNDAARKESNKAIESSFDRLNKRYYQGQFAGNSSDYILKKAQALKRSIDASNASISQTETYYKFRKWLSQEGRLNELEPSKILLPPTYGGTSGKQ